MAKTLKIIKIGNSRGVRLPASVLAKYRLSETVAVEFRSDEIALRPSEAGQLSWEETFKQMGAENASEGDDFAYMERTVADGLSQLDR